ncbi:MAG TPA: hemolysin, partial [Flavobacteriaceae bacterium]|nr:hemolysin [Flavobacteriaceae bacterium]
LLVEWFAQWPTQWPLLRWMVEEGALVTQTIISTLVILVTAEFLPKVLFQIYANTLIKTLAIPAFVFYQLFSLFSTFVIKISDGILRLFFNTKGDEVQIAFSKVELEDYIQEHMDQVEDQDDVDTEIQIFQNALEFSNVKAREIMIPRTELMAVA